MGNPNVRITNGSHGTRTHTGAATYTAAPGTIFRGIQTLAATEFGAATADPGETGDGISNIGGSVPAGIYMEGRWTVVEVVSGTVRLYLEPA
jgi:hypothetical protein